MPSAKSLPVLALTLIGLLIGGVGQPVELTEDRREGTATADADDLWSQRSQSADGYHASPILASRIVAAYEEALDRHPESLELRWKLLRALHFQGDYALGEDISRLEHYERSRGIADAAREYLAQRVGKPLGDLDPPQIAEILSDVQGASQIYVYSAILWGRWGESTGKMKAARQGVAGKLRNFAEVSILLDEHIDGAGGRRFLGRMHTEAPKIPFVTGWIDRGQAVTELERALELASDEPYNRLFLADALLRFEPDRRDEALNLLDEVVGKPPRPHRLVEDRAAIADARDLLAEIRR